MLHKMDEPSLNKLLHDHERGKLDQICRHAGRDAIDDSRPSGGRRLVELGEKKVPRGRAGPRTASSLDICRVVGNATHVVINETRVAIAWDEPMPGVGRPWFECPVCDRRVRHVYLRDRIACRRCHRLDYACRHIGRQTPGVARVARLPRRLRDCELRPFAPLPARTQLLGHLQGVTRDLHRRIRVRQARGQW